MIICGVDPGLRTSGYAVIDAADKTLIRDAGVIRSDDRAPLAERLGAIYRALDQLLDETRPGVLAVENVYSHYNHPQTAVLMGHVRGVVLLSAAARRIGVASYSATQIKRCLTGNGRAGKTQMQRAIALTLGLESCPEPHDVADALAVALCQATLGRGASQAVVS